MTNTVLEFPKKNLSAIDQWELNKVLSHLGHKLLEVKGPHTVTVLNGSLELDPITKPSIVVLAGELSDSQTKEVRDIIASLA